MSHVNGSLLEQMYYPAVLARITRGSWGKRVAWRLSIRGMDVCVTIFVGTKRISFIRRKRMNISKYQFSQKYHIQIDVRVPMRDGVTLSTDVYLPSKEGTFPTMLVRTIYDLSLIHI